MKNVLVGILVVGLVFILLTCLWYACRTERFSSDFQKSQTSLEFMQYVDMGDHRTMVLMQKGNNGETVLLLHNSPMNLNIWMPLFQTMQRMNMSGINTPNLVAYDLRGFGTAWLPVDPKYNDLDPSNHAWTLEQYVEDCKKIVDGVIGNSKIKLCGFGIGGIIAQKYALTYPDKVQKLILLQTSISPMEGPQMAINYLGGPNGWIAQNPGITYLTSQEEFINNILCRWFYLPNNPICANIADPLIDESDYANNDQDTPQYNLVARMWRQGSSTSELQAAKMLVNTDLIAEWQQAENVPFGIHILTATDDPLAPPDKMTETYTAIYNTNRQVMVALDIVNGRHGFTIMRPDYIAGIICQGCKPISAEHTYTPISENHGF